jgi:hypothetical protein
MLELPAAPPLLESRVARFENDAVSVRFAPSSVYRPPR